MVRGTPAGYLSGSEPPSDPESEGDDSLFGDMSPRRFRAFEDLVALFLVEAPGPGEPMSVPIAAPAEAPWSGGSSPSGVPVGRLESESGGAHLESVGV